jgi:hypothetical protein
MWSPEMDVIDSLRDGDPESDVVVGLTPEGAGAFENGRHSSSSKEEYVSR